jgi:hypothetical protein
MSSKKKLQNNKMIENVMIGVCVLIIIVLIYLIYKKLSSEENFRFQVLTPKRQDNFIESYNTQIIDNQLKNILNDRELSFFKDKLKQNINDPKFIKTIKTLKKINNNLNFKEKKINARFLLPLTNDIDIEDSLKKILQNPKNVDSYLKGELTPVDLGSKIVTGGDNRYILDGHNRWCQVYIINPHCQIEIIDFINIGISIDIDVINKEKIKGINIYNADEKFLKDYINKNITDDVVNVFKNNGYRSKDDVITYILGNIRFLKTRNKNVENMYSNRKVKENFA